VDGLALDHQFVRLFRIAALQAGAVARHLQGKTRTESKGGGTPEAQALTAVDLATQDVILHLLHAEMPEVAMDAEEDTPTVALFEPADAQRALVVVDPVDGTLNYIRGSRDYAVMGALLREGRYTAAVVHFPVHGTSYWAVRGEGCFEVDHLGQETRCTVAGAADRIFHSPRTPKAWRSRLAALTTDVSLCRCSAVDGSAPVTGRARASIAEGRADRRRAIALFLSWEAGATVLMGEHRWQGEDPETLPAGFGPTVVADTADMAQAIRRAVGAS
jgi:fructose-1,6-bisphosphatase/inositol monophosphatase family enzyme